MKIMKCGVLGLLALAMSPAVAQDEGRADSPGNSGGDRGDPPSDPGPPFLVEDEGNPGNSGDPQGAPPFNEPPGPPDVPIQLADGTASVYDEDVLIGYVKTLSVSYQGPVDKMETWVFDPDTLYQAPMAFDVEVTSGKGMPLDGGVSLDAHWSAVLEEAEADGWVHVCLGVNYVNPISYKGQPASVIDSLGAPVITSSYTLSRNGQVVGWLFRGQGADGAVGDLYGLSAEYKWPLKDEVLEFTPLTGLDAFADVDEYLAFLETQDLLPKGLGLASYSAPAPAGPATDCNSSVAPFSGP